MLSMAIFVIEFVRNFVGDIMPWYVSLILLDVEQMT